ncbi:MAG: TlpA disulfide reductase family protein [Patescibacteria group bacterium]|nr:TlpA disulfide reductase family protein [Patescibacteria group bacterium]
MKKIFFFSFLIYFTSSLCAQNQVLTIHPLKPESGDTVTVTYIGDLAKPDTEISYFFNYMGENRFKNEIIPSEFQNNKITGRFKLPDTVLYVSIKITNGKEFDNNRDKGYGFNVYENGKPKKGTFFTQGAVSLYNKYFFNAKVDTLKAIQLMEKEYQLHPDLKESTLPIYLSTLKLDKSKEAEAVKLATEYYNKILETGKNDNFTERIVETIVGRDHQKRDSLINEVIKKHPKGKAALRKQYIDFYFMAMYLPDSALTRYNSIVENFSDIEPEMRTQLTHSLITTYRGLLDYDNFEKHISKVNDPSFLAREYNEIAWKMATKDKDMDLAKKYSEKSLLNVDKMMEVKKPETTRIIFLRNKANYLDTYAYILNKLGDTQGAVDNEVKSAELFNWENLGANENVVQYLVNNKQFEDALSKSENFIKDKYGSAKMDSLYKVAYIALNGDDNGLHQALENLKNAGNLSYIEELKKKMISMPAPDFSLKDDEGNTVRLSDFKGSVVILDFWASWCGPCIASFPAMLKAMNELKGEDVVFLFINTQEYDNSDEKRLEAISKTLDDKFADFRVLIDEKNNDQFLVGNLYNVKAIPVKFFIDKQGTLRYSSTGFESEEKLVKELKALVNVLK